MFVVVGDVAVEDDALACKVAGVVAELVFPPAGADHVEHHVVEGSDGVDGVLDLLVWHEPGQGDHVGAAVVGEGGQFGGHWVHSVFDDADRRRVHPERLQVAFRGLRDRHIRRPAIHPRRHLGFQPPAEPPDDRPSHRPLFLVAVVGEQHGRGPRVEACEEGDAVLGVHDDVGPVPPRGEWREQVDAVFAAGTFEADAVSAGDARGVGVFRGAVDHLVAGGRERFADAFQVRLGAATLWVGGVAPTHQQYLHCHVPYPPPGHVGTFVALVALVSL